MTRQKLVGSRQAAYRRLLRGLTDRELVIEGRLPVPMWARRLIWRERERRDERTH